MNTEISVLPRKTARLLASLLLLVFASCAPNEPPSSRPNFILIVPDDLGWGDVGFNGHSTPTTPNLDQLAARGIVFERFYAASPVCSPTRVSLLTGRHGYRSGITGANVGHLGSEETTLAEILRDAGYATGFFGKWHLGTLTTQREDGNRARTGDATDFTTPAMHGFDVYFATESKVPTFDPMLRPVRFDENRGESLRKGWLRVAGGTASEPYGSHYWTNPNAPETHDLKGDDSEILMNRVVPFIESAVERGTPFFAVVWLHTPHLPVVADRDHRQPFIDLSFHEQVYYGAIRAMDEQVGRLGRELERLEVSDETLLCFVSDNGPSREGPGSAGPFRGKKGSLFEGGIRVPAFCVWPDRIKAGLVSRFPAVTHDFLPTMTDLLGIEGAGGPVLDGISLRPVFEDGEERRSQPIGFQHRRQTAWVTERFKLISLNDGQTYALYDLAADPGEQHDLAANQPDRVVAMKAELNAWVKSTAPDGRAPSR